MQVDHKKTFFYLEQVILKHNAHSHTIKIDQMPTGLDFYFKDKSHANKFIDFISSIVPVKYDSVGVGSLILCVAARLMFVFGGCGPSGTRAPSSWCRMTSTAARTCTSTPLC